MTRIKFGDHKSWAFKNANDGLYNKQSPQDSKLSQGDIADALSEDSDEPQSEVERKDDLGPSMDG